MKRIRLAAPLALWLALTVPQGALADGGQVPPVQGSYIGVPGSPYRYAAIAAGRGTVVEQQEAGAGAAVAALRVPGHYGIPGVDYSGSMTGLSADGRTLVLAEIPGGTPPRATRLLVLGASPVAVRARLTLAGWSTVDAISSDGRWLYLIQYPSSDISNYEVLAYDLPAHRLLAKPVVRPARARRSVTRAVIDTRTFAVSSGGRHSPVAPVRPSVAKCPARPGTINTAGWSLPALADAIGSLAARARNRELTAADMRGVTFTISNAGPLGAWRSPAVVPPSNVAIMGLPTVVRTPVAVNLPDGSEVVAIRPIINLAVTYDHRALDGSDVGAFLKDVKAFLEGKTLDAYL